MSQKRWMRNPDSGGVKIPDSVKHSVEKRIQVFASEHFKGSYSRIDLRFRGQFCYIDAYCESKTEDYDLLPGDRAESREEFMDRMQKTPTYLCRLRYFGNEDLWGFAFYTYSNEKYELSMFPTGDFFGSPEDAFEISANVYLRT